jgi:hypothetical protein
VLHELAPVDESETVDTAPHEAPERTEEEPARVDEPPRPEKVARLDKPAPADERARVDESPPVDLEGTVRLVGFVRTQDVYKGRPIKGAQVTVTPGGTTTTNANGLYQIRVPVGTVTVAVQAKGYEPHSEVKELEPDIENWKTMVLVKPGEQRPPAVP